MLVDTRSRADYLAKHILGAANLSADKQLSHRAGFVVAPEWRRHPTLQPQLKSVGVQTWMI